MAVLEIYLEILTNFFEILYPPLNCYLKIRIIGSNYINIYMDYYSLVPNTLFLRKNRKGMGFIKSTDPPTTYPPVHRPVVIKLVKTEDRILNMFCNPKSFKTFFVNQFMLLLNKQIINALQWSAFMEKTMRNNCFENIKFLLFSKIRTFLN